VEKRARGPEGGYANFPRLFDVLWSDSCRGLSPLPACPVDGSDAPLRIKSSPRLSFKLAQGMPQPKNCSQPSAFPPLRYSIIPSPRLIAASGTIGERTPTSH
jgi:hypothetical protein